MLQSPTFGLSVATPVVAAGSPITKVSKSSLGISLEEDCKVIDWLPELADVITDLAVGVGAGVPVIGDREGVDGGVGSVGAGSRPAGQSEDAADSKSRGTCP